MYTYLISLTTKISWSLNIVSELQVYNVLGSIFFQPHVVVYIISESPWVWILHVTLINYKNIYKFTPLHVCT